MAVVRERGRQGEAPLQKRGGDRRVQVAQSCGVLSCGSKVMVLQRGLDASQIRNCELAEIPLADRPPEGLAILPPVGSGENVGCLLVGHYDNDPAPCLVPG